MKLLIIFLNISKLPLSQTELAVLLTYKLFQVSINQNNTLLYLSLGGSVISCMQDFCWRHTISFVAFTIVNLFGLSINRDCVWQGGLQELNCCVCNSLPSCLTTCPHSREHTRNPKCPFIKYSPDKGDLKIIKLYYFVTKRFLIFTGPSKMPLHYYSALPAPVRHTI